METTFRKTKSGEWVAFGPADTVQAEATIKISKRSGETTVKLVERVGRSFQVNGVEMVYGYLAPESRPVQTRAPRARSGNGGGICDECEEPRRNLVECEDSSGLTGRCCPRCAAIGRFARSFA